MENLARQGYQAYLPLMPLRRRRGGRAIHGTGPMFPRYLFIHLGAGEDDWRPIRSTVGIRSLVRFGQSPARVPDALIETLKSREDEAGVQVLPPRDIAHGQKVRIANGLFEGYEGLFVAKTARERVILLIQVLEKRMKLEIEQDNIEVI